MKILQIINSHNLEDGGAQRLALEMHGAYLARGHESHLLSLMDSPTDSPNTYSLGITNPYRGNVLARLCRFLKQPRWKDVDLIHVHLFPAQLWVAVAAKWLGLSAPLITTEHNTFNRRRESRVGRWCDRWTLDCYRRIACISPATYEALSHWQPQTTQKLVVVTNGIDLKRYQTTNPTKRDDEVPIVISVGRLSQQKNYDTAIRAVEIIKECQFQYWIVGQDELDGEVQRLASALGLNDRVRFLGYQADIPNLLRQAEIFLLTSRWEGFGLAVAEAMATGLPVICSDVPGVREVVHGHSGTDNDSPCGYLVDPQSPPAVAMRLDELLNRPDLRRSLGESARQRAQQFDLAHTITDYLKLYEQVLDTTRATLAMADI